MNEITCFVLDDQKESAQPVIQYIQQTAGLKLLGSSRNPSEALIQLAKEPPDLLFLDINMPEITGLDFAKRIQFLPTRIVIISAHSEYGVQAIKLNVVHYLLKPITYDDFLEAVQRFRASSIPSAPINPKPATGAISVRVFSGKKEVLESISIAEILYAEANNNCVNLFLEGRMIVTHTTLRELEKTLPKNSFQTIHRSYLAGLAHIVSIEGAFVILSNGTRLPVSRSYQHVMKQRMAEK